MFNSHKSIELKKAFCLLAFLFCQFDFLYVNAQQPAARLFQAIKSNDLESAKKLVKKRKLVKMPDEYGDYPLMNAAIYGSLDMMKLLLKKGSDPNEKNNGGETALMWSTHDLEKMKLLINNGADVNTAANTGNTALLIASVGKDQSELIKYLISRGADPLVKNKKKETCLMRAAYFGDTATISLLISAGIEIDAKDTSGSTALLNAIFNVNRPATLLLLDKGADPDLRAAFGLTAVSGVVTYNDMPSINAVLQRAKEINTVDNGGVSALMWAVYNEHDNPGIIRALIDKGADVNHKAKDGSTALSWALKKGNTKTVALLIQAGAK